MRRFFRNARKPIGKISYEVHCLRLGDGKKIWKKQVIQAQPPHRVHPSNTYATESPVAVGNRVYAYFATIGVVACLDKNGTEIWRRNVGTTRRRAVLAPAVHSLTTAARSFSSSTTSKSHCDGF
ncbi:MAG: hypothetical protein Ct9H300mP1_31260 [Planctomycetaceae bacterium]|nr:MAG: hypothetical protein Ct9H300mP1_31260 [Planctomycetaceae bacterium]